MARDSLWQQQEELQIRFSHHQSEANRIAADYERLGAARSAVEATTII